MALEKVSCVKFRPNLHDQDLYSQYHIDRNRSIRRTPWCYCEEDKKWIKSIFVFECSLYFQASVISLADGREKTITHIINFHWQGRISYKIKNWIDLSGSSRITTATKNRSIKLKHSDCFCGFFFVGRRGIFVVVWALHWNKPFVQPPYLRLDVINCFIPLNVKGLREQSIYL